MVTEVGRKIWGWKENMGRGSKIWQVARKYGMWLVWKPKSDYFSISLSIFSSRNERHTLKRDFWYKKQNRKLASEILRKNPLEKKTL